MEKTCSKCGLIKPVSEFYKRAKSLDGLQCWCKSCSRESVDAYQAREEKSVLHRSAKYGLTKDEVRAVMAVPCCQACGAEFTDDYEQKFDHCHDGGHFRGVLCHPCNMACAGAATGTAARLAKCIDYLLRDDERTQ